MSTAAVYIDTDNYPGATRAWLRLLLACLFSIALHFFVLTEVPVSPGGSAVAPPTIISARLASAEQNAAAPAVTTPESTTAESSAKSVSVEPVVDPAPKPEDTKPVAKSDAAAPPTRTAGIEVPFIGDPTYYPTRELDVYPLPLTEPRFDFPERATASGITEGSVLVLLFIDEFGVVNRAEVIEANPPGIFEEVARANWLGVRFSHGVKQGRAVKSRIQFRTRYTQELPGSPLPQ